MNGSDKFCSRKKLSSFWWLVWFIGFVILLAIVLVVSLVVFALVYFRMTNGRKIETKTSYEYQTIHINTEENEMSLGFVSIFEEIEKDDFISYVDDQGFNVLISNFGDEEYICTGFCECENSELERRSSSTRLFSKGVTYLLVAASMTIAYELSQVHFDEECVDICPLGNMVRSEIDECKLVFDEDSDNLLLIQKETLEGEYFCKGACMDNPEAKEKTEQKCVDIKQETIMKITPEKYGFNFDYTKQDMGMMIPNRWFSVLWAKNELDEFCREASQFSCIGYDSSRAFIDGMIIHETTNCRKIKEKL